MSTVLSLRLPFQVTVYVAEVCLFLAYRGWYLPNSPTLLFACLYPTLVSLRHCHCSCTLCRYVQERETRHSGREKVRLSSTILWENCKLARDVCAKTMMEKTSPTMLQTIVNPFLKAAS